MKRQIKLGVLFIITFLISLQVNAVQSCTDSEMERLRELANNVQFKTNSKIEEGKDQTDDGIVDVVYNSYDIQIINFDSDLKIKYKNGLNEEITLTSETTSINDLYEGYKYTFYIYSYTDNLCTDRVLKTVSVDLPIYNKYYHSNKEKCEEYPDFKYCKKYLDATTKSFSEIDKEFDEYIKSNNSALNPDKINWNIIYIIGGVILILSIVVILIIVKKKKQNEDL